MAEQEMRQVQQRFRRRRARPFTPRDIRAGMRWLERYIWRRANGCGIAFTPCTVEFIDEPEYRTHSLLVAVAYAYLPEREGQVFRLPRVKDRVPV